MFEWESRNIDGHVVSMCNVKAMEPWRLQQQAMEPWRLQPALEPQWLNFNSTGQIFCQPQDQARSSWDNLPPGNLPPCSNDEMAVQKAVQKAVT